ncbi:hypothetical protein RD110_18610 [Rhodoferax koreense]|uniref:Uncharacterized protein n=1 Tax=Rhodoferax koreensis TaxID=1842727 RepID=A0A1P8JYY5_9BURK|nr:MltR family transcriptional regulator [Rhodoferax koreense]APW38967.1 hypothetical protein RD110_18610 [Rhodoferax koreense]
MNDPDHIAARDKSKGELRAKILAGLSEREAALTSELLDFKESLAGESDRAAVVRAGQFLDDRLKLLIAASMVDEKKPVNEFLEYKGPAGEFSARIKLAYFFGLIPVNARNELRALKEIRNRFAHTASSMTFEDDKVKSFCGQLKFHGVPKGATQLDGQEIPLISIFRRSMFGLAVHITRAICKATHASSPTDYEIPNGKEVMSIYARSLISNSKYAHLLVDPTGSQEG